LKKLGFKLKAEVNSIFGRSLAIRELDSGSDNAAEIEMNNLSTPHYDVDDSASHSWLRRATPMCWRSPGQ